MHVLVCNQLSGKNPLRQVGVDRVVPLGSVGGVMVSTLTCNAEKAVPCVHILSPSFHSAPSGIQDQQPQRITQ